MPMSDAPAAGGRPRRSTTVGSEGPAVSTDGLDDLRAEWRRWMGERLPAVARSHPEWPIRLDHCFGRVVLDAVYGRPWREVLKPPAWRHMDRRALEAALDLAAAIAEGRVDLVELNRRSLEMRGKGSPRP